MKAHAVSIEDPKLREEVFLKSLHRSVCGCRNTAGNWLVYSMRNYYVSNAGREARGRVYKPCSQETYRRVDKRRQK